MAKDPYEVMDLKALRCFWATAKHASMPQGGIELGISEAAVRNASRRWSVIWRRSSTSPEGAE